MNENKDYFMEQWNENEDYLSAAGDELDDIYFEGDPEWLAADAGNAAAESVSRPFIFTLDNTTAGTLTDVVFLDAARSIGQTNNGVTAGVSVTYDISGWSYAQFLYHMQTASYEIRELYLECSTTSQLTESLKIEVNKPNGDGSFITLSPRIDPNQNQTTSLTEKCSFVLDAYLKITIANLQATNNLTISMYPRLKYDQSRELFGKNPVKGYQGPGIRRPMRVIGK